LPEAGIPGRPPAKKQFVAAAAIHRNARTPLAASANGKANPRAVPTVED